MRMVGLLALVVGALPAPAWSGEIYSWTDKSGAVHYSNTPTPGAQRVHVTDSDSTPSPASAAAAGGSREGSAPDAERDTFSTQASLQRTALERSMRDTERRLADIDARLAGLARARTERAAGSAATGGVGTNPAYESEQERALREQRKELADHMAALQSDYTKLRTEVATRLGGEPAWWVEYRPGRR